MFDALVDRISAVLWNLRPDRAVALGKHAYDGFVPDVSDDFADGQYRRLGALSQQLRGLAELSPDQDLDRRHLLAVVEREVFGHEILRERTDQTFQVTITTTRPADAMCTEALVPFEETFSLDVYSLPAGTYTVNVNGITDTFELAVDNVSPDEAAPNG